MRDFTLAAVTPTQLQQCQRAFVQQILVMIDKKDDQKGVTAYAELSLSFHIAAAVELPLSSDQLGQDLILHSSETIIFQALRGMKSLQVVLTHCSICQ